MKIEYLKQKNLQSKFLVKKLEIKIFRPTVGTQIFEVYERNIQGRKIFESKLKFHGKK